LRPVAAQERILLMDLLRGLAMFGVLWSNLNDWYGVDDPHTTIQHIFRWIQDYVIESRFYTLLGFLFGYGFAIQLMRAEERGADVRVMFYRRMAALLAIGMVHGLFLWRGDILTGYAIAGAFLALFRRWPPRALVAAAAVMLAVVPALEFIGVAVFHIHLPPWPDQRRVDWVYTHGSIVQVAAMGREGYLFWYRRWAPFVLPPFLSLFLLGLCTAKTKLLERLSTDRPRLIRISLWAAASVFAGYALLRGTAYLWPGEGAKAAANPLRQSVFWVLNHGPIWSGALMYASALAAVAANPATVSRLRPLAAIGQMSLTTYLTQTLISVTLFYPFGFGLYGHATLLQIFAIAIVVFSLQMAASLWWLKRYRFGPMEWLWRSIAYLEWQPRRREPAA
jgi:uncharacterized protein